MTDKTCTLSMSDQEMQVEELGIRIPTKRCTLPLDPIKTAASVTTYEPILEWAERAEVQAAWATDAVNLVVDGAYYAKRMQPKMVRQEDSSFALWNTTDLTRKEMTDLSSKEIKVLRPLRDGEVYLSRSRLFKTPKDLEIARLVMDGRETISSGP